MNPKMSQEQQNNMSSSASIIPQQERHHLSQKQQEERPTMTLPDLPSSLLPSILSYTISNTRDFARLRLISQQITKIALPLVLTSSNGSSKRGHFVKCCYTDNEKESFLSKLVSIEEDDWEGTTWNMKGKGLCLFEKCTTQSIFLIEEFDQFTKSSTTTRLTDFNHEELCESICNSTNMMVLKTRNQIAVQKGTYLPVSQPTTSAPKKQKGVNDCFTYYRAIITLKVPHDAPCIVPQKGDDTSSILLSCIVPEEDIVDGDEVITSDNKQVFVLPVRKDEGCLFPGHIIHNTSTTMNNNNENIVRVAMNVRIHYDSMGEFQYDADIEMLYFSSLWNKYQERMLVPEGVVIVDGILSDSQSQLMTLIDQLASNQHEPDYHPHSNNIVRDLVHPALYSYIKGVSPILSSLKEVQPCFSFNDDDDEQQQAMKEDTKNDYWGRKYEESTYQWLPTYFDISADGSCTICDYINNLTPRKNYEELYSVLENLFSRALPFLESVYSYGRQVKPRLRQDDDNDNLSYDASFPDAIEEKYCSLRGQRLQVITKIVDYELEPGRSYEGVWHVEGMSHEEIVATALYVVHRDSEIVGGDILFKRAFHRREAEYIFSSISQCRPPLLDDIISDGLMPLGKVQTPAGRLVVFPNSHVHKVRTIKNNHEVTTKNDDDNRSNEERGKPKHERNTMEKKNSDCSKKSFSTRRIVVFFLINPEKRILSTREVSPQQLECGGLMTREEAFEHRLELMKERKYTKQDWNVREIELCEH